MSLFRLLYDEIASENFDEVQELKQQNDELKSENDRLKTENDRLKTENDRLKSEIDRLQSGNDQLPERSAKVVAYTNVDYIDVLFRHRQPNCEFFLLFVCL